jgi:hypothetical protein
MKMYLALIGFRLVLLVITGLAAWTCCAQAESRSVTPAKAGVT